ncbi:MAG TPA: GrpB family protein [Solirubrobacteraceae bacterium]|nr:GrpB family protein [Solirubrobacteraceae bacterium]
MGLPDPDDVAAYDELMAEITIGEPEALSGSIVVQDYDPAWPGCYERHAARIAGALGDRVIRLEHAGSTSVPGLPAKPIIDIVLEVPDSAAESAYVPDLEAAGYILRIREPDWFEHRLFRTGERGVHLHVFSAAAPEVERMVRFRDHLRADATDRALYARVKRELAARDWKYMQQYADAKSEVVADIMSRADPGRP